MIAISSTILTSSVATVVVHVTVQHALNGEVNLLGGCVTTSQADAISKGGGGSKNVAGSTLHWDVGIGGGEGKGVKKVISSAIIPAHSTTSLAFC